MTLTSAYYHIAIRGLDLDLGPAIAIRLEAERLDEAGRRLVAVQLPAWVWRHTDFVSVPATFGGGYQLRTPFGKVDVSFDVDLNLNGTCILVSAEKEQA